MDKAEVLTIQLSCAKNGRLAAWLSPRLALALALRYAALSHLRDETRSSTGVPPGAWGTPARETRRIPFCVHETKFTESGGKRPSLRMEAPHHPNTDVRRTQEI